MVMEPAPSRHVIGMRVDAVDYAQAVGRIMERVSSGAGGYLCAANVHMAVETHSDPDFHRVVDGAFLIVPDGQPLRWALGRLGLPLADRVYGPELAHRTCAEAARRGIPIGLYGGREEWRGPLCEALAARHPGLRIVWSYAPPFRPLTPEEDASVLAALTASGARIVMVGLGCPKQERWMAAMSGRTDAVLLGVGAFFDLAAGRTRPAPRWMARSGLEWMHRAWREPRRLGVRYLRTNPRFVALLGWQLLRRAFTRDG